MATTKTPLGISFGRRCRQLRNATGESQLEFSSRIGMDRSYYASIEVGDRNVTLASMAKIADGFGLELDELLTGVSAGDVLERPLAEEATWHPQGEEPGPEPA